MKAAELAEKLLEYPRANVLIDDGGGDIPIDVRYNPLTNNLFVETA